MFGKVLSKIKGDEYNFDLVKHNANVDKIIGHNTDIDGFELAIKETNYDVRGKKVLICINLIILKSVLKLRPIATAQPPPLRNGGCYPTLRPDQHAALRDH